MLKDEVGILKIKIYLHTFGKGLKAMDQNPEETDNIAIWTTGRRTKFW